jgi:hypothetical protein
LRLVAAMIRTSAVRGFASPTRSKVRSCTSRSSLGCSERGKSPTSSRNNVPPSAAATLPVVSRIAPVNAPLAASDRPAVHGGRVFLAASVGGQLQRGRFRRLQLEREQPEAARPRLPATRAACRLQGRQQVRRFGLGQPANSPARHGRVVRRNR